MRRAAKKDVNHNAIVRALRDVGASVFETHQLGGGFPDICAGFRGQTFLLEVKHGREWLTPAEREFFDPWRGHAVIVRTVDEALRAIGAIE